MFEALARFAAHLAAANSLLIALEDLHWSDAASLDFLRAFTHRVADRPMLLIATYRSDEQPPQLVRFLAQVNRERAADELVLAPLSRTQAAEMTRQILKLETLPGDEFLDVIMRLTEGNPFFIEEILKTLTEAGNALGDVGTWKRLSAKELQVPSSVYDAVQRRMERLKPETRQVLTLAAAIGQRLSFELLRQVSSKDVHDLLAAIKDLLAAHLLVEESADQFAFRHALTRDAVYTGMLHRERSVKCCTSRSAKQWSGFGEQRATPMLRNSPIILTGQRFGIKRSRIRSARASKRKSSTRRAKPWPISRVP